MANKKRLNCGTFGLISVIIMGSLYAWNDPDIRFRISILGEKVPVTSEVRVVLSKSRMTLTRSINGKAIKVTPIFVVGKEGNLGNIPESRYPLLPANFGKTPPGLMEVQTDIMGTIPKLPPGEKSKIQTSPSKIDSALKEKKPGTIFIIVTRIPGKKIVGDKEAEALPNHYVRKQLEKAQESSKIELWHIIHYDPDITKGVSTIEVGG